MDTHGAYRDALTTGIVQLQAHRIAQAIWARALKPPISGTWARVAASNASGLSAEYRGRASQRHLAETLAESSAASPLMRCRPVEQGTHGGRTRCSTLDGEEVPPPWDAFQPRAAAIAEAEARPRNEVLDRA